MEMLAKKPLFNPDGDTDVRLRRMIGGNTTNLNDFNNMRYSWVSGWYRQAMNNFWIPEEISLAQDVKDYPRLDAAERTAYDKILSFLVFLDSIQTANLPNLGEYITANEVNLCLNRALMANYILEGVYFYSGFMFFYNLSRNGKMPGSAQEIRYINRDENTHLWLFRNIILELQKEQPELFGTENVRMMRELLEEGVRQETAWGHYVIGDVIPGLTRQMVTDYIRYLGNLRWTSLGFGTLYEGYEAEPANMAWVSQYSNANLVKTDFFEAKSTAYAKSTALVDDL